MKKAFFVLPLALFLSGCFMAETYEQRMNRFHSQCYDYGFEPGTEGFARCMQDASYHEEKLNLQAQKINQRNLWQQQHRNNAMMQQNVIPGRYQPWPHVSHYQSSHGKLQTRGIPGGYQQKYNRTTTDFYVG